MCRPSRADQPELEVVGFTLGHQPLERRLDDRRTVSVVGGDVRRDVVRVIDLVDPVDAVHLVGPDHPTGRDVVLPAAGLADLLRARQQVGHVCEVLLGAPLRR